MTKPELQEIKKIFCDALRDVVERVSGVQLEEAEVENETALDNIVAVVSLSGNEHGQLLVYANQVTLKHLASSMTGTAEENINDDDICDTAAELANILAGSAKVLFGNGGFAYAMASPFVLTGENVKVVLKKNTDRFVCELCNADMRIGLTVIY